MNEPGHLVAGLSYWHRGTFKFYNVNPPLVRLVASFPAVIQGADVDWTHVSLVAGSRSDFRVGRDFFTANGQEAFYYLTCGRLALIPIMIVGGLVCFRWAYDLYGYRSGMLALALWCTSPNLLAWGATITSDAVAAAIGVTACYAFWRQSRRREIGLSIVTGMLFGTALLTKFTWIILFPLWLLMWMWFRPCEQVSHRMRTCFHDAYVLAAVFVIAILVVNIGYRFEGSFTPLGEYEFHSSTLTGNTSFKAKNASSGNRFQNSVLSALRVPLPQQFVLGIDEQRRRFESGMTGYLRGEHRKGGWWYYYIVASMVKIPLGTWGLVLLAVCASLTVPSKYWAGWQSEFSLLLPAIAVFVLASSQSEVSRYFRYILPCAPFMFIWASKAVQPVSRSIMSISGLGITLAVWAITSSLWIFPFSLSYFNEISRGPAFGHEWLIDSNIDWGQDLWRLKRWLADNPHARSIEIDVLSSLPIEDYAVVDGITIIDVSGRATSWPSNSAWSAISVHRLRFPVHEQLLSTRPVARIGYSILIFNVDEEPTNSSSWQF